MEQQHLSSADEAGEAEARLVWLVDAAREDERARWARELHDDTLQGLATLRLKLSAARACSDAAQLEQALEGAIEQVTREIGNLRALLVELRPPELRELGLAVALEALFDRARELHGLAVTTDVRLRGVLADEVQTAVYRVVQEALHNAARHADAGVVEVRVHERRGRLVLSVRDDGCGFDPRAAAGGYGVRGMRERIALARGRFEIQSSAQGTIVAATLPVGRAARSVWTSQRPAARAVARSASVAAS